MEPLPPSTVGETLPTGVAAIADGGYPEVFENATVDGSFGVTSPIYIDQLTPFGFLLNTLAVPADLVTTSFSSKSELAVNLSQDGHHLTFMGYVAPINTLDVSIQYAGPPTDKSVTSSYQRAVAESTSWACPGDACGRLQRRQRSCGDPWRQRKLLYGRQCRQWVRDAGDRYSEQYGR